MYSIMPVRVFHRGNEGSRVGAVVRAVAFHQCVPGSIPGLGVISGLSLLVLYSALTPPSLPHQVYIDRCINLCSVGKDIT